MTLAEYRKHGTYTSVGSYPVYALMQDGEYLCHACAAAEDLHDGCGCGVRCKEHDAQWCFAGADVYWEGPDMYCANCNAALESAYGDPDAPEDSE